jgi:hypothetical protein
LQLVLIDDDGSGRQMLRLRQLPHLLLMLSGWHPCRRSAKIMRILTGDRNLSFLSISGLGAGSSSSLQRGNREESNPQLVSHSFYLLSAGLGKVAALIGQASPRR